MPVSVSDGQPSYTHQPCSHGKCLNHGPQWERIGQPYFQIYPSFFFGRIKFLDRWVHNHCGTSMERRSKYVLRCCKLCGREEQLLLASLVAFCTCCGYHATVRQSIFERSASKWNNWAKPTHQD